MNLSTEIIWDIYYYLNDDPISMLNLKHTSNMFYNVYLYASEITGDGTNSTGHYIEYKINDNIDCVPIAFNQIKINQVLNKIPKNYESKLVPVFHPSGIDIDQLIPIIDQYFVNSLIRAESGDHYLYMNNSWIRRERAFGGIFLQQIKDLSEYLQILNNNHINNNTDFWSNTMRHIIDLTRSNIFRVGLLNYGTDLIEKQMDVNNYLIGFENGVYDLQKFEFRETKYDDYISMSVGYDYQKEHTNKHHELLQFLEDILPDKKDRDELLTYLSSGLVGNIFNKTMVLYGNGANGKSTLLELLYETTGDYLATIPSYFLEKNNSHEKSPEILSMKNKRIIIGEEINDISNDGFIKWINSDDTIATGGVYPGKIIQIRPNFISLLVSYDIPKCNDSVKRRLKYTKFPIQFVDEPANKNQKKRIYEMRDKVDDWKMDFMLLLIEYHKKYVKK